MLPILVPITFVLLLHPFTILASPPVIRNAKNNDKLINALDPEEVIQKPIGFDKIDDPVQIIQPKKAAHKDPTLVRRPDHLDGVPLERDGHLNKQFRQEVVLGKDILKEDSHVEETKKHKDNAESDLVNNLINIFTRADVDKDKFLTDSEIRDLIHLNTLKHLDDAVAETHKIFKEIDQNEDGLLSWDPEYHYHFVVDNKMMDKERAKSHKEEEHNNDDQQTIEFEHEAWNEADLDEDSFLDKEEFLAFRHPEHSQKMLEQMVINIMQSLDTQQIDGRLSEDEFAAPPAHGKVDQDWAQQEEAYFEERRAEFKDAIDIDKDGFASKSEMIAYSNPRNEQHSRRETRELLELADVDHDNRLSLDEIMAKKEIFLGSGLLHPERAMHDEM